MAMQRRGWFRTGCLGVGVLAAVGAITSAGALPIDSANALCPANADPCRIDTNMLLAVADGAILDFGMRTLEVVRGGLDAGSGVLMIHAGTLVVRSHGRLHAASTTDAGGTISITTAGAITVESGAGSDGEIAVSGTSGGVILLQAAGALTIAGRLRADGLAQDGDGGLIGIAAGSARTDALATTSATSGRFGAGGGVSITTAGDAFLDGDIDATGGSGFGSPDIAIEAGGSLRLGGAIDAGGTLDDVEGDGGAVALRATGGEIWVAGAINVRASTAGYGGSVDIDAAGPVTLRAPITATGGAPDGTGGDVSIRADGIVEQAVTAARIDAGATGIGSSAGSVTILARGGTTLRGIDASAGSEGGSVTVLADVSLRVVGPIGVDGFGGTGLAGSVDLRTSGTATIEGAIHADAPPGELGGVVSVLACAINLSRGGTVSANGASGLTLLRGDDALTVAGRLQAGAENRLATSGHGSPPIVTGTVAPTPTIAVDPAIAACGQTVATTSTTTTTTRTTTTRTTMSTTSTTVPSTTTTSTAANTSTTATTTTSITSSTTSSVTTTSSTTTTSTATISSTTTTAASTTTTTAANSSSTTTSTTTTTLPGCDDLACDDGDPCTVDGCDGSLCAHTVPPDPALLPCRIAAVRYAIDAADFSHARKLRTRLGVQLGRSETMIASALDRVGPRRVRSFKQAIKLMGTLRRSIERAGTRGLLAPTDVEQIGTPIRTVATWLDGLEVSARRSP